MKQKIILLGIGLSIISSTVLAASHGGYSMTAPAAFPVYNTSSASTWSDANNHSTELMGGGSAITTNGTLPRAPGYQLLESQIGCPIEHLKPEYYLGDAVEPPEGSIDYEATTNAYIQLGYNRDAIFIAESDGQEKIYFSEGGAIVIPWIFTDGTTDTHTYQVAATGRGKPYRIFWTDAPYNSPAIDLNGNYVDFFGDRSVLDNIIGPITNYNNGEQIITTGITKGLYFDQSTQLLNVVGGVEGRVVMAYYRTGSRSDCLGTIVLEVSEPDIKTGNGKIGRQLLPTGDGYNTDDLAANVTAGLEELDEVGSYVYQHQGDSFDSPKNGNVYAIRRTTGEGWKIEIYWEMTDFMGTDWPFEVLHYDCDWPEDAQLYVRGDIDNNFGMEVSIPDDYLVEIENYQEPMGHATLEEDLFYTDAEGYSLLRLTGTDVNGQDNVWFLPVHSVWRTRPEFDLTPNCWPVAKEVVPLASSVALDFEGDAYVDTGITNLNGSFTVEGWFKITEDTTQILFSSEHDVHTGEEQHDFLMEYSGNRFYAMMGSGDPADVYSAKLMANNIQLNTWYHLAFAYEADNREASFFLDGQRVNSSTSIYDRQYDPDHYIIALGAYDRAGADLCDFYGCMDDVRIWNSVRTEEQIQDNMNGFLHAVESEAGLVAYYPIENTIGREIKDHSGNGNHAPLVNASRVAPGAVGLSDLAGFNAYHPYIYPPVSGDNFATDLYIEPGDLVETNSLESIDPVDGSIDPGAASYIFGVNDTGENDDPVEIWWSHDVSQDNMPASVWFPAWVQQYSFQWPGESYTTPEIVLCSQLGSEGTSAYKAGVALDLSESANSYMQIPEGEWFSGADFTVEYWIKPHSLKYQFGDIFNFSTDSANRVINEVRTDGTYKFIVGDIHIYSGGSLTEGQWSHIALSVNDGKASVYLNNEPQSVSYSSGSGVPQLYGTTANNYISGKGNNFDGQIDDFRIWETARTEDEIKNTMFEVLSGNEEGLRLCYDFDGDIVDGVSGPRTAHDKVNHTVATISYASWILPGAPRHQDGLLQTADNEPPVLYYQNDPDSAGYNPNEEHAFIEKADYGGYAIYALRNDLNTPESSEPYVIVQYKDPVTERIGMQLYHVVATNLLYNRFADTMSAGSIVPGPHPLDYLPEPWMLETYWDRNGSNADPNLCPGYKDRAGRVWAKNAGQLTLFNYYPMQESFNFPDMEIQPDIGSSVAWLGGSENAEAPVGWDWTVQWPEINASLDIGQTLTTAVNDLPDVWNAKSLTIIYQTDTTAAPAVLFDPTQTRSAALPVEVDFLEEYGFENGKTAHIKNGYTYFYNMPPSVSDRLYYDPYAPADECLKLKGKLVEHTGGLSYLQLNLLNNEEKEAIKALCTNEEHRDTWENAVDQLPDSCLSALEVVSCDSFAEAYPDSGYASGDTDGITIFDSILADHYALTHLGTGTGCVVIVENDSRNEACNIDSGDPVAMHIIQLTTNLYTGSVLPVEDPNNLLSEQLDMVYTESFAGKADDFEFEWKWAKPNEDGSTPTDYEFTYNQYGDPDAGKTRFTIGDGDDTLNDMVNKFFVVRYRATTNSPAYAITGNTWSDWVGPTLAEGWVERTLNNITPFTQRLQDLYNNPAETSLSMIEQAGGPYSGPVALNQDNLNEVGLIQLYETILDTAESKSLRLEINDSAANQQLMLAATRLNDLYVLLGNEAYADALDPTIGFGSDFESTFDYGSLHSSLFCFDNLVSNLRDEELALLRGRSDNQAPSLQLSPTYNRLYWNFTKGITAGEVAYAVNYQIQGTDSTIDAPQAAALYPMGHGDAWGHYLSALYHYYRLMRNPCFSWGTPSISALMVGDAVVDADYYDEEKFAETAASLVRVGAEIVKRTAEKSFVENDGTPLAGYIDSDPSRAFGYGEWGSRAGQMALYNWVAANSLLPENPAVNTNFVDDGILRINRSTAAGLGELAAGMKALQQTVDAADSGMTPLGLSGAAIPFDIDPAELAAGKSHFEQVCERAETALGNAEALLDRAQSVTRLLRQQQQTEYNMEEDLANEEAALNTQLIGIYGYPYDDDIGVGGTYPEDYSGPDLYHYMWVDLKQYGLEVPDEEELEVISYEADSRWWFNSEEEHTHTFDIAFAPNGIVQKPKDITGSRRAQGSLQAAYGSFVEACLALEHTEDEYREDVEILSLKQSIANAKIAVEIGSVAGEVAVCIADCWSSGTSGASVLKIADLFSDEEFNHFNFEDIRALTGGFAESEAVFNSSEAQRLRDQATAKAVKEGFRQMAELEYSTARKIDEKEAQSAKRKAEREEKKENLVKGLENAVKIYKALSGLYLEHQSEYLELVEQCTKVEEKIAAVESAYAKFVNAQEAFISVQASGEQLQAKRERLRKQAVNRIAAGRYQDMAFRTFRNEALARYSNAFDLAKKYTYLATKAYDYETALNLDDVYEPGSIYREIVGTRSIGHLDDDGIPQLGGIYGDGGLAEILARLKNNWLVLDGRLGINNAQVETKWTSLRKGCFRIPSSGKVAAESWASTLDDCKVDNLLDHASFRRYCLPFNSTQGLDGLEPGLVIPFRTTINFAENLFGRPLASQDQAFNSSYYATKIRKVGVKFTGYNMTTDNSEGVLSSEPQAYLIPVGFDMMRSPGSDGGDTFAYTVVDQVVPNPFPLAGECLDEQDWTALYDSYLGGDEPMATIRRYPSLRVYSDQDSTDIDMISNSRLVGRSIWNTQWLLIIPAGSLHYNREYALHALIYGTKDSSGHVIQRGITDIEIGFETYSNAGN